MEHSSSGKSFRSISLPPQISDVSKESTLHPVSGESTITPPTPHVSKESTTRINPRFLISGKSKIPQPRELNLCFLCFTGIGHIMPAIKFAKRIKSLVKDQKIRHIQRNRSGNSIYHPQGIVRSTIFCQLSYTDMKNLDFEILDDIDIVIRLIKEPTEEREVSSDGTCVGSSSGSSSSSASCSGNFSLFTEESKSGAWARRVINYYKKGWRSIEPSSYDSSSYRTALVDETDEIYYEHLSTRSNLKPNEAFARIPDCIIADMFISFDGEISKAFNNIPCWEFHPSNLIMAGYDYQRRMMPYEDVCSFHKTDQWRKSKDHHLIKAEVTRRPHRKGIIVNDVEDWYTYSIIDQVSYSNCTAAESWNDIHDEGSAAGGGGCSKPWEVLCVGPLLLNDLKPPSYTDKLKTWMEQLEVNDKNFIYITMGSQFDMKKETSIALARWIRGSCYNRSKTYFLWANREDMVEVRDQVNGVDGVLMIPWVDQLSVLQSNRLLCVITHAGWNGLLEIMTLSDAPILCMPLGAEQGFNARCVQDYYKNGIILKGLNDTELNIKSFSEVFELKNSKFEHTTKRPEFSKSGLYKPIAHRAFQNSSKRNVYRFLQTLI